MKWLEKSRRSKRTLNSHMHHEDDYGMNEDSNLSHSVRASLKENSQRTTTITDNKKERQRKRRIFNAWWLMPWHQLRSHVPQVFQVTSHFVLDFCSVLRVVNSICRCTNLFNFWPVRKFLVEIHTAKTGLVRCCLYTPRWLQQTAVSCKRSNCNKIENIFFKKKTWKSLVWGFTQRPNLAECAARAIRVF